MGYVILFNACCRFDEWNAISLLGRITLIIILVTIASGAESNGESKLIYYISPKQLRTNYPIGKPVWMTTV